MKKLLIATLGFVLSGSALAGTQIVKPVKYIEGSDDVIGVRTSKGDMGIYVNFLDEKSIKSLDSAMKKKGCVKIKDGGGEVLITATKCTKNLKKPYSITP